MSARKDLRRVLKACGLRKNASDYERAEALRLAVRAYGYQTVRKLRQEAERERVAKREAKRLEKAGVAGGSDPLSRFARACKQCGVSIPEAVLLIAQQASDEQKATLLEKLGEGTGSQPSSYVPHCPECGASVENSLNRKCPHCGARLSAAKSVRAARDELVREQLGGREPVDAIEKSRTRQVVHDANAGLQAACLREEREERGAP